MDSQIQFLRAIWGHVGFGEIRGLGLPEVSGEALPYQAWVDLACDDPVFEMDLLFNLNLAKQYDRDVYFGVLPRVRRGGTASDVTGTTKVVWADVDAKMHDHSKQSALSALNKVSPEPNILVDSGGGYHAYWLLRNPIKTEVGTSIMKGIAKACGGDHTYDAPRILRLPGTPNHKYSTWPEARIMTFNTTRLLPYGDLEPFLEQDEDVQRAFRPRPEVSVPVPTWLEELINTHFEKGSRSEAAFRAALWLWRYGYTEDEIEGIFEKAPIGESYREKGAGGHRWLSHMISKFD
jgi:hypothetical protein